MPTIKEQCEAIWQARIQQELVVNIWCEHNGCVMIDWEAYYEDDD